MRTRRARGTAETRTDSATATERSAGYAGVLYLYTAACHPWISIEVVWRL